MQKALIAALLLTTLNACTSPYGNYAALPNATNAQLADETAHEMTVLYPPATTHLSLSQPVNDAYGMELVKQLREAGYAVQDDDKETLPAADTELLPISYTVDGISNGLYRITLRANSQVLSRVYSATNDGFVPAGSWTRKE